MYNPHLEEMCDACPADVLCTGCITWETHMHGGKVNMDAFWWRYIGLGGVCPPWDEEEEETENGGD